MNIYAKEANKLPSAFSLEDSDRCTAILVAPGASEDGSSMTTHNADCAECDWRVNKIEAKDWPKDSKRPIHLLSGTYPRQVREDRGYTWTKDNLEDTEMRKVWESMEDYTLMGHIPQVEHTYELIEAMYGIQNEFQVAIGESTCASKLYAAPIGTPSGKALLEASELTQIALERTTNARDACQMMGDLAVKYGFYSAAWGSESSPEELMSEGGEALTVIDPNEAWMFHILPDDTGSSAIWVAQKVPHDHITVAANSFVIRDVDPNSDDFMYSDNLWSVAKRLGWWDENDGKLDFLKTYAPTRLHPEYSNRRRWRVLSWACPSCNLESDGNAWGDYLPFSVKPDKPLKASDIMAMNRDHYEGTDYDLTKGVAAGPYGEPNRFDVGVHDGMTLRETVSGGFERAISLFRTSYSFVAEARKNKDNMFARIWLSQYAPDASTFLPLYVKGEIPHGMRVGSMHTFNHHSSWWNYALSGNWASKFYMHAMVMLRELQIPLETQLMADANALEDKMEKETDKANIIKTLQLFVYKSGDDVLKKWQDLFPRLVSTYRDGYHITGHDKANVAVNRLFYPETWLRSVGFYDKLTGYLPGIMYQPAPGYLSGAGDDTDGPPHQRRGLFLLSVIIFAFCLGYMAASDFKLKSFQQLQQHTPAWASCLFGPNSNNSDSNSTDSNSGIELNYNRGNDTRIYQSIPFCA